MHCSYSNSCISTMRAACHRGETWQNKQIKNHSSSDLAVGHVSSLPPETNTSQPKWDSRAVCFFCFWLKTHQTRTYQRRASQETRGDGGGHLRAQELTACLSSGDGARRPFPSPKGIGERGQTPILKLRRPEGRPKGRGTGQSSLTWQQRRRRGHSGRGRGLTPAPLTPLGPRVGSRDAATPWKTR